VTLAYLAGQYFGEEKITIDEAKQQLLWQSVVTDNKPAQTNESASEQTGVPEETVIPDEIQDQEEMQEQISDEQISSLDISDFPVGVDYGTPQPISSGSISYSDIRGLEISQTTLPDDLTCENITDYLTENTEGYYWWNTCREIQKDNGISLFFLKLTDEAYIYQKQYFIPQDNLVGIYEIETAETGELEDKLSYLKEKNTELKEKNTEYPIIDIVDNLFIEILQK